MRRLSLNGWPPVASHMACVLLGLSLAHLTRAPAPTLSLPSPSLALTMPVGKVERHLTRGAKVHLVQARAASRFCRLTSEPLTMFGRGTLVMLPRQSGQSATPPTALWHALRDRKVTAMAASKSTQLPICAITPKVNYGPS